ncbi:vitellogenin-1-like [Calliphora vicina]|uniref:vitellogenin-1-like n=1 Tax=Calliphora vicina TaxID=7373 RepID=UPI00325AF19D
MNPLRIFCVAVLLMAAVSAVPNQPQPYMSMRQNGVSGKLKPSQWLSSSELEQIPSVEDISLQSLENMAVEKGAKLIEKIFHLSQINHDLKPNFVPSPSSVACYIVKPNGQKVSTTLDKLASVCKQQSNFGDEEVTIFITGLPATTETIKKANRKLIDAYLQRYNIKRQQPQRYDISGEKSARTSSEEDSSEWKKQERSSGNLVIIDLGAKLNSLKRFVMLDVEETGAMIGSAIVDLTDKCNVADETVHVIAQGIAAHVAGAAANDYTRQTGRKLRRITALDPSKLFAKNPHTLSGLSRGDAEFVDAIHTNVYGMGTIQRVGDVDFYPNGPSASVPGAENIVEASMRATRYFAESVRPGNERNFPAVAANSLKDYKNNDGFGKRVYMGIDTDYDLEGDFILQVNSKSPFGKSAPAKKQNSYHGIHKSWKNSEDY